MKYVALYEQALASLIGKEVNQLIMEGGNLTIGDHEAQHLDLKVTSRGYMVPKLNQLLQAISKGYASTTGEELWSNELLSSGKFLSGSSLHFFNVKGIPDETFVEKKPTVGDIDTMVDRTKEVELQQFLKSIENKKIGPATFLGFQRGNEQFSGLFELQDPPVKIQVDFEFVEFINGLPTDWARFSHSSSWEDLQSGIKGVFHKWLIRALAGLSKKTFYQRKMVGRGKLRKEEDVPVTDKMYSFAVSSKEGGGLRPKYEPVLDANNQPEYKDDLPVMRATATAGYERDIGQIFRNLFGVRLTPQQEKKVAQKFWSFTGLLDIINSLVSPEEKQKVLDDFLEVTIGPGSQGMYKNNPDKDIKEKTVAIDTLLTKLGLQKPANFDEMLKNYRATYKMTADESRNDFRTKPDSIVARMAKKALGEAAPSYRRVGIQHLYNPGNSMEIKDIEFIQLCKEIMEDGGNLAGADLSLKVDGAGIRFGKDEQGKPFFMTSKVTEPKYIENYGDFEAFGRSTGQSDERLAFTKNYDEALKTILTAPFMKKLPADTIVQAEMLFNPMAKKDSDGYTFVNIPYDPKKLGSDMTLVPIFVKQYSNGETRPDSQKIKQALIDSSDSKIKIFGTAIKNKGVNVSNIVKPIISHEAELTTALKSRGDSSAKEKAKEVISRAKKSLSETIMNSDMPGKDSLGEIIEGIVIRMPNGRLLKITSSHMKEKMAAKQAISKKSTTDSNRHKPAVVTIGSFVGHRGHQELINRTIDTAKSVGGDPYVYVSPVTGVDDPVPPDVKVTTLRKLFPSIADNIKVWDSAGSPVKKIEKELVLPSNSPYNKIIVMVGSDRVDGFRNWLSALERRMKDPAALAKYGGTQNQVDYEVIGIPREEADGGNGLSFSKLRNVLIDPNKSSEEQLQAWVSGFDVSKLGAEWIKRLMDITRQGMGISESSISSIQKYKVDIDKFEKSFGNLLSENSVRGLSSRETYANFMKFANENNVNPLVYYSVLNQKIEEKFHNGLNESIDSDNEQDLKTIFEQFSKFATYNNSVRSGDKVCLLELQAEDLGPNNRTIHLSGFTDLKEVKQISSTHLYFDDGKVYPSLPIIQTRIWKQIAVFDNQEDLKKCLTAMSLLVGKVDGSNGDWKFIIDEVGNLSEADNPNYFGGSSMSAIPGTPPDLQPQPSEEDEKAYREEMADLKRFLRK